MQLGLLALFGVVLGGLSCAKATSEGTPAEAPSSGPPASISGKPALECAIRVAPRIKLGEPVTLHFRLATSGPARAPLYVLNWRTPLEGLRGDDFLIVHDGVELSYSGPMFKRADPPARNYLTLESGKALEAEVDLSLAYDFGKPGKYRITFRGPVRDLVTEQADVPRPMDRHQPVPVQCGPVETELTPS